MCLRFRAPLFACKFSRNLLPVELVENITAKFSVLAGDQQTELWITTKPKLYEMVFCYAKICEIAFKICELLHLFVHFR